jgi:hypothetical protein
MRTGHLKSVFVKALGSAQAAACLLSLAMLLCFPASTPHNFRDHFRVPELTRSVKRHTFVAAPQSDPSAAIQSSSLIPSDSVAVPEPDHSAFIAGAIPAFSISLPRLLRRLKLAPSGASGGFDPLP